MNLAIEIPDDVANALAARIGGVPQAVLEAVAVSAYRSGATMPAQVQRMLGHLSRWETEAFLRHAEAHHDDTVDDLDATSRPSTTRQGNNRVAKDRCSPR